MVLGLFSKERALKKTIERANNKLGQHMDRFAAMDKLRENGSEEALFALCRRFSFHYDKTIEDQKEKEWTVDALAANPSASLTPLRRYMKGATSLGYPLAVLEKIADKAKTLEVVDELLAAEEPGYTRDPKKRIDIIEWLAEFEGTNAAEVCQRVTPYLEDFDENVRVKTVEAIAQKPDAQAAAPLVAALVRPEEESTRLRQRIADVLAQNHWGVSGHEDRVAAMVKDVLKGFALKGQNLVRK